MPPILSEEISDPSLKILSINGRKQQEFNEQRLNDTSMEQEANSTICIDSDDCSSFFDVNVSN